MAWPSWPWSDVSVTRAPRVARWGGDFRGKEPSWGWENARSAGFTIGRLCVFNNMVAFIFILASGMAILAMVQQGRDAPATTDRPLFFNKITALTSPIFYFQ